MQFLSDNNIFTVSFKRIVFKESLQILFLIAFTILVIYGLPKIFGIFLVLTIAGLFWFSKKNYFWFAYFFIIICSPGSFFSEGGLADAPYRLPLFSFGSGFSFSTHDVFMILAFVKAIFKGNKYHYFLTKPLLLILFYIFFLLFVSIIFLSTSGSTLSDLLRLTSFYSLFISFPYLVHKKSEIHKFIYLTFPIVFFIFFTSVYFFVSGEHFLYLFNPESLRELKLGTGGGGRYGIYGGGHMLLLFTFIFSLILILEPGKKQKIYLFIIAAMSYLSIFLTATRIWFVVYTLILLVFLKISKKRFVFWAFAGSIFFVFTILQLSPRIYVGAEKSWQRISTIFTLGQEDSDATRSIEVKVETDMPRILEGIKQNPVTGWGYSDRYMMYGSNDVGNWNLIFQIGFLGFLLFIYLWKSYLSLVNRARKMMNKSDPNRKIYNLLTATFIGLLIAHFTTHQVFGLTMQNYHNYFLALYIFYSEFFVRQAIQYENSIYKLNYKNI